MILTTSELIYNLNVQAKEFEDCETINVSSLSLTEDGVFVIWKWLWTEHDSEQDEAMSDFGEVNDSITVNYRSVGRY